MPKKKPCNLTKAEWALFLKIFDFYHYENDLTDKEVGQMESIHEKIFFMDYLIRDMDYLVREQE